MSIDYSSGYKHQLNTGFQVKLPWAAGHPGRLVRVELKADGTLVLEKGFAWDGPSYPGSDTPEGMDTFARASAVHDALYRLMVNRVLDYRVHRLKADETMRALCLEDGMVEGQADLCYRAVRSLGDAYAMPPGERPKLPAWPVQDARD